MKAERSFLNRTLESSPSDPTGPRFCFEDIFPCIDGGRYAVKRVAGETVDVWADIFREGHDVLAAALLWRRQDAGEWQRAPMALHGNDRWHGQFTPPEPGFYIFELEAWTDQFATWRKEFLLKQKAGQNVALEAREGIELLTQLMPAEARLRPVVDAAIQKFQTGNDPAALLDDNLAAAMSEGAARPDLSRSIPGKSVV